MRHPLLTLALAALAGSLPGAAHAQIRITPQSFGGRTSPVVLYGNSGQPISASEHEPTHAGSSFCHTLVKSEMVEK